MILLKATNETLQMIVTTAANIDFSVSYADITTTSFLPSSNEGSVVAGTQSILAAPAASTQRQTKLITISNRHASLSNTVAVQKLIASTTYNLTPTVTLLAGETMQYMDGQGWMYYSATGAIKSTQTAAGSNTQVQYSNNGVLSGDAGQPWGRWLNRADPADWCLNITSNTCPWNTRNIQPGTVRKNALDETGSGW